MDDDKAVRLHRLLAGYHAKLARECVLDIIHEYHANLAEQLRHEADRIPERTAARLRVEEHFREGGTPL